MARIEVKFPGDCSVRTCAHSFAIGSTACVSKLLYHVKFWTPPAHGVGHLVRRKFRQPSR
eukprot:1760201-Amphidinium_carterae.1